MIIGVEKNSGNIGLSTIQGTIPSLHPSPYGRSEYRPTPRRGEYSIDLTQGIRAQPWPFVTLRKKDENKVEELASGNRGGSPAPMPRQIVGLSLWMRLSDLCSPHSRVQMAPHPHHLLVAVAVRAVRRQRYATKCNAETLYARQGSPHQVLLDQRLMNVYPSFSLWHTPCTNKFLWRFTTWTLCQRRATDR